VLAKAHMFCIFVAIQATVLVLRSVCDKNESVQVQVMIVRSFAVFIISDRSVGQNAD